jgi:ankyrin repeat protein
MSDCSDDVDVDLYKSWGNPLVIACFDCDRATVEQLLDAGADINGKNNMGITPFHAACIACGPDPECVRLAKFLAGRGADTHAHPGCQNSPLVSACIYGRTGVVEYLLDEVAVDIEEKVELDMASFPGRPTTALDWALVTNDVGCARVLLGAGANAAEYVDGGCKRSLLSDDAKALVDAFCTAAAK